MSCHVMSCHVVSCHEKLITITYYIPCSKQERIHKYRLTMPAVTSSPAVFKEIPSVSPTSNRSVLHSIDVLRHGDNDDGQTASRSTIVRKCVQFNLVDVRWIQDPYDPDSCDLDPCDSDECEPRCSRSPAHNKVRKLYISRLAMSTEYCLKMCQK